MTVPHKYPEKTFRNTASPNWWKLYILIVYMNRNIVGDYGGELDWQRDPFRTAPLPPRVHTLFPVHPHSAHTPDVHPHSAPPTCTRPLHPTRTHALCPPRAPTLCTPCVPTFCTPTRAHALRPPYASTLCTPHVRPRSALPTCTHAWALPSPSLPLQGRLRILRDFRARGQARSWYLDRLGLSRQLPASPKPPCLPLLGLHGLLFPQSCSPPTTCVHFLGLKAGENTLSPFRRPEAPEQGVSRTGACYGSERGSVPGSPSFCSGSPRLVRSHHWVSASVLTWRSPCASVSSCSRLLIRTGAYWIRGFSRFSVTSSEPNLLHPQ